MYITTVETDALRCYSDHKTCYSWQECWFGLSTSTTDLDSGMEAM